MKEQKRIIVLGGGYSGVLTAKKLSKKYKNNKEVEILLIDKKPYNTMLSELHEVAAGRVEESAIKMNLEKIMYGRNVKVVLDKINNIDFDNKKVIGKNEYKYDYLVVATGSKPTFYGCEGAKENAFTLWSYEDAVKIKQHILNTVEKASVELDKKNRKALLTFVVVGCGFTGIEMVGELAEWADRLSKDFSIDRNEFRIIVTDLVPRVLVNFKEKMIVKTEKRLRKMNVEIMTSSQVKQINKDNILIGEEDYIDTYTAIWAAGIEGSDLAENIKAEKESRNRIITDKYLRKIGSEDTFIAGDNIFYIVEGEENAVPQMIENAEHSASLISKNIISSIEGKELKEYKPVFHGAMLCIGGRYGVAQVGTPKKQYVLSGFLAMFIKHFINIVYFFQVLGFNKVWSYLQHEIFRVNDDRSFTGGYFSKRSPNFFLVPLRLFVGFKWFIEGFDKMNQIIKDPDKIFLIPQKVVEGVGAASEAVQNYAEPMPVPGFISDIVNWSMDLIFYTSDGSFTFAAKVFQFLMVTGEIVVGLCLIAGLFTFLASIVSLVMSAMIWSSGMAPFEMLWYVFATIAIIGGGGSVFSLDYYFMPILKRFWKKIKFVKKNYLYTD